MSSSPPPLPPSVPSSDPPDPDQVLLRVVAEVALYPLEAYLFVNEGVGITVKKLHGERTDPAKNMHVTGRQLCMGLRELAVHRWGMLAGTVLRRWAITSTMDFGRIVFALVESGLMSKTDQDRIDDFRDVYDFKSAFDSGYRIAIKP